MVEPQKIFVPALIDALEKAGIEAAIVTPRFDPMQAALLEPPMIFLDVDIDTATPREVVRFAKEVAPFSRVVVYTSEEQDAFRDAGADEIVSKTLQPAAFVDRMRRLARLGRG